MFPCPPLHCKLCYMCKEVFGDSCTQFFNHHHLPAVGPGAFRLPKVISELQATCILLAGHRLKFLICSIKQRNAKNCLCKPEFRESADIRRNHLNKAWWNCLFTSVQLYTGVVEGPSATLCALPDFPFFQQGHWTSRMQSQHSNHGSYGQKPTSTLSLQKNQAEEISEKTFQKFTLWAILNRLVKKLFKKLHYPLSLSPTITAISFFNLQGALTWSVDRNHPLVCYHFTTHSLALRKIPSESQDMSRQLAPSEMALNNPVAPIKAEKPALFKKWLDSFCVGVGEDYWSQTGSELCWITWRACILTDTGNKGTAGTSGGCKWPSWLFGSIPEIQACHLGYAEGTANSTEVQPCPGPGHYPSRWDCSWILCLAVSIVSQSLTWGTAGLGNWHATRSIVRVG